MAILKIKDKALRELFENGRSAKVRPDLQSKALLILDYLDGATDLAQCTGVQNFHPLKCDRKGQHAMHVNGNWCVVFEWDGTGVTVLSLEDYH